MVPEIKGSFAELQWLPKFSFQMQQAVKESGSVFHWHKRLICFERPCAEGRTCTMVSIMQS